MGKIYLEFTNGDETVKVKKGSEWYPILLITPITFIIGGIIAFKKKQFSLVIVNMIMLYLATTFVIALVFSMTASGQSGVYEFSLVTQSPAAIIAFIVMEFIYIFTMMKFVMHVGDYKINSLVNKGYALVDMSKENIELVEHANKFKKPFWVIDN